MDHLYYLFAAYTVVWIGIAAYVRHLGSRTHELEREIEELKQLSTPRS